MTDRLIKFKYIIYIFLIVSIISLFFNSQFSTRKLGGSYTENLSPNLKVVNVTWKENSLWILTRPMRDNEQAESYQFKESAVFGLLEGTVTIKEVKVK